MRRVAKILVPVVQLFVAPPTSAKPGHGDPQPVAVLTISGPGFDGPLLLHGDSVWRVLYLATFRSADLAGVDPPPPSRLGAAFEARYRFVLPDGSVRTLRQTLYPCASGGTVWTFTPAGQDPVLHGFGASTQIVKTGWWHADALERTLGAAGLVDACERARALATVVPGASGGSLVLLWAGLALLVSLLALGPLRLRARRKRAVAGA